MTGPEERGGFLLIKEGKERIFPKRLVVKFGTANLCTPNDNGEMRLNQAVFDDYARQIMKLKRQGVQVIVVSSGAIQSGKEEIQPQDAEEGQLNKQDLAGVGQPLLMSRWREAFKKAGGRSVSQLLLTYTNWSNKNERKNIIDHIFNTLNTGLTPIINENDPIADQEIKSWERRISENDRLARMVAGLVNADAVLFLTDEGGIFTSDPQKDPEARLLTEIPRRTEVRERELASILGASPKGENQGMRAKWREASSCFKRGMRVAIAGREEDVILRFANGEPVGTKIGETLRFRE